MRDRESGNFNNMIGVGMCRGGIADAIAIVMVLLAMIVEGVVIVVVGHRRKCVRGSSGLGNGCGSGGYPEERSKCIRENGRRGRFPTRGERGRAVIGTPYFTKRFYDLACKKKLAEHGVQGMVSLTDQSDSIFDL